MATTLRRLRIAAAASLLLAALSARAQTLAVGLAPSTAPLQAGVTHGRPSSFSLNVTNSKAGTKLRQIEFRLPNGYTAQGGAGPDGWTVTRIKSSGAWSVLFRVADCSLNGIAATSTGTFRLDVTPPGGAIAGDTTDNLSRISPSDPCGGTTGWSTTSPSQVQIPRRTLLVTGTANVTDGPTPMTATVTWTVTNLTTAAKTVTLAQAATPPAGVSASCTPPSIALAAGAASSFTCTESITAGGSYLFQAGASAAGSTAVGAVVGPIRSGGVTASFAFDDVNAGPGDQVQATLTLRNNTSAPVATVTPPGYSALVLQNLEVPNGSKDPGATSLAAGATTSFVYTLAVNGVVGATYVAKATASTSAGPTGEAVTPAGTIAASTVNWAPAAVVKARTAAPYQFTITVVNNSATAVSEIDVINKQPSLWTGMTTVSTTPLTTIKTSGNPVDTIKYTGTLAAKATATITVRFAAVPTVTQTTAYPFQVKIVPSGGGKYTTTYDDDLSVAIPIPDVAGLTILSNTGGQVLAWANTGRSDAQHDGVVVFRTAAPAVPLVPQDFVDYSDPANQTPANGVFYADRDGSTTASLADAAVGTYNYRVCNHDALFVYSSCNTGFWNNAGYLDSAVAPVGGWTHQLGGAVYFTPGVIAGNRVAVASNRQEVTLLDADTGLRTFDPLPLGSLPAASTPAATMTDGRSLIFGAGNAGGALAFDLGAGTTAWQVTKPGETFVAGISGIVRAFAAAGYQSAWSGDTILLPSSVASGHLLGVDYATGGTLWTLTAGAPLYAAATYDAGTNRIFVPAFGGGVLAWDVGSTPGAPPVAASGWTNPGGSYKLPCVVGPGAADLACVDTSGTVRVLDTTTGAVRYAFATGVSSPNALRRISGTSPGYLVSSTTQVQRLALGGSPLALSLAGAWTAPAGVTLAPAQAFPNPGIIAVACSDKKLRKLDLATVTDTGIAVDVPGPAASVLLGPPVFDSINSQFVFGTEYGRVWAIPSSAL